MPDPPLDTNRRPLTVSFFTFLLLTLAWQGFYCVVLTRADPVGLFYAGEMSPRPPELDGSFQYPHSTGYDGQAYWILAHDPLDHKGYWKYLDDPRYRSRRILIPGLAALLAGGNPKLVDLSFIAVTDLILAFGAICFLRLTAAWILPVGALAIYALLPAVVASTDRMVVDGPAVAGFVAVLLCFRERRWVACLALLAVLPLVRESGILVSAGVGLAFLVRRDYRHAAWTAASAVPVLAWWGFGASHTPPSNTIYALSFPVWPQIARLFQPFPRTVSAPLNLLLESLDLVACICLLAAFFWFGRTVYTEFRKGGWEEDTVIVLPSVVLAAAASSRLIMGEAYAFMRVDSVLLAWVVLRMVRRRPLWGAGYATACSLALLAFRANPILKVLGR
jgi:hypothetical protein